MVIAVNLHSAVLGVVGFKKAVFNETVILPYVKLHSSVESVFRSI